MLPTVGAVETQTLSEIGVFVRREAVSRSLSKRPRELDSRKVTSIVIELKSSHVSSRIPFLHGGKRRSIRGSELMGQFIEVDLCRHSRLSERSRGHTPEVPDGGGVLSVAHEAGFSKAEADHKQPILLQTNRTSYPVSGGMGFSADWHQSVLLVGTGTCALTWWVGQRLRRSCSEDIPSPIGEGRLKASLEQVLPLERIASTDGGLEMGEPLTISARPMTPWPTTSTTGSSVQPPQALMQSLHKRFGGLDFLLGI
ncbi:hypothetical protein BDV96DRAFT_595809 [Lophiotrema nucula]|uniref:Uncharacterized protein n=1 Tax=Lophiotrema nucula TaxID=690887 RepID=A0A6A5ZPR1_9PLEO|nr:hypothetical protein BDV96DRAFT_595809 [Lophiotrema nucula]